MGEDNYIYLENLNDKQKILLSEISYLNLTEEGKQKVENGGLLVSDLLNYIEDPDKFYVGNGGMNEQTIENNISKSMGAENYITKNDLVVNLIESGLGNVKITDVSSNKNGFQAMTFEDNYGNTGISFRPSDFETSQNFLGDWLEANFLEYFTSKSKQSEDAIKYFDEHKNTNGNNFIYGYSLGGNLAEHTLVEKYDEIEQVFVINPNPINQKLIDTPEKKAVFNNPDKFQCKVISGDLVGLLKSHEVYKDNVDYIKNHDLENSNFISSHLLTSAVYDENGNLVEVSGKEMENGVGQGLKNTANFFQIVRETLNKIGNNLSLNISKEQYDLYTEILMNDIRSFIENKNIENDIKYKFNDAARVSEQIYLASINNYLNKPVETYEDTIGRIIK